MLLMVMSLARVVFAYMELTSCCFSLTLHLSVASSKIQIIVPQYSFNFVAVDSTMLFYFTQTI